MLKRFFLTIMTLLLMQSEVLAGGDNPAYENFLKRANVSDYYINLIKYKGEANLKLEIYSKSNLRYSKYFSKDILDNYSDYRNEELYIYRKQDGLVIHFYNKKKNLSYDLGMKLDGSIDLSEGENYTGDGLSLAIQTFGDIKNNCPISFYALSTCGNSINNKSILSAEYLHLLHHYYYNGGVIDFKNKFINGLEVSQYYMNLFATFASQHPNGYNFKKASLDNDGVIISNGLQAGSDNSPGFSVNSSGGFISENFKLCGQNNTITTNGSFVVNKELSGRIDNFNIGQTIVKVGRAVTNLMRNVDNRGELVFGEDTKLNIKNLNNLGKITGLKNLSLVVEALTGGGVISAKGALDFISKAKKEIAKKIDDSMAEAKRIDGYLLGGSGRKIKQITDHYLNTITIEKDEHGVEIRRTETGYIFQYREESLNDIPLSSNEKNALDNILDGVFNAMGQLNDALSDLESIENAILKGVSNYVAQHGSSNDLQVNLSSLLSAQGIDGQRQTGMVNNFMSVPYSCNALRLSASVAAGASSALGRNNFFKDLENLEYEKKVAAEKNKRKSWSDAAHVNNIKGARLELSLEAIVANATLMRYEFEQWKERNPEAYDAFLKSVDAYNSAVLGKSAAAALLEAIPTRGASILKFAAGASLFAGAEYIANLISSYGSDRIAKYCAKNDKAKYESYLKTCDYFIDFVANHGLYFCLNKKAASGSLRVKEQPKVARVMATKLDADKYLRGLIEQKGVLSKKMKTLDGHEYYRFEKKCEYKGIEFKKGDYISRDTLHHEWEFFRGEKTHKGAIDPLTGEIQKDSQKADRTLKVK